MWTYVLLLGFAMLMDPARLGIAAVLMSRRRGIRYLLAFWLGGMLAGISIALAVLVMLHDTALVAIRYATSMFNGVRSAVVILTGGGLHITLGLIMLLVLVVLVTRERARVRTPVAVGGGDAPEVALRPRKPSPAERMAARTMAMLESGGDWPAFFAGFTSSVPPVEGPMALAAIMASRAAIGIQLSAFVVFIIVVLVFIEIPLVGYLAAPEKTQAVMLRMNHWIHAHRAQILKTVLAVIGVAFLVRGIGSL